VAETIASARSAQPNSQASPFWTRRKTWGRWTARVLVLAIFGFVCFIIGQRSQFHLITEGSALIAKLQNENQALTATNTAQATQIATLQGQLKTVQGQLDDIFRADRMLQLDPNQSVFVSSGRFPVSLIGPPSNEKVNVNINGKPQSASVGDTFSVDLSTTCRVQVMSFDLFRAVFSTTCVPNP
jgi:cell division protein FtsB